MKPWCLMGSLLAALSAGLQAEPPSLCERLAARARQAPAASWAAADPLAAWVRPATPRALARGAAESAEQARWRALLGLSAQENVFVNALAGTPLRQIEQVEGTAACQRSRILLARPGRPARALPVPFDLGGEAALCTTQSARLVRVLGEPALWVGGAPSMTSADLHYRMARWTGRDWQGACRLTLRRATALRPAAQACLPGHALCEPGRAAALQLAQAYEAMRASAGELDARALNGGREPDAEWFAAVAPGLDDAEQPEPAFWTLPGGAGAASDPMRFELSNAAPRTLPLWFEGRWWLARVGRSGVGWREGDAVLVALRSAPGRAQDSVALYQFRVEATGLREAIAQPARR